MCLQALKEPSNTKSRSCLLPTFLFSPFFQTHE
jgi:hypothetical protein